MPAQASREAQFSAIVAAPARELADPAELELAGRHQARDRRPKLSPRTRSWTLQIAISDLYFIPEGAEPVRSTAERLRMFPRSHPQRRWKQAWEQRKPLILL